MKIIQTALAFAVFALVSMPASSVPDEAEQHFVKGQKIIGNNCGDCVDSSRSGLEDGILELEFADRNGYADKAAIYKLLYQAYGSIAFVFAEPDSEDMKKYVGLRRLMLDRLIALLPNDPVFLYEYAAGVQDKDEQLKLMQRVIHLDPKNVSARLLVGLRLIEAGQHDSGVKQLKRAVNDASPEVKELYRDRAIEKLIQYGYKSEVDRWLKQSGQLKGPSSK